MTSNHYDTLGISRDASMEEIKRAYRRLARVHHPDANLGDPAAEERFKQVTSAYEVLSDPARRERYDTYGDDKAPPGFGDFGDLGGISDLFSTFFGGMGGTAQRRPPTHGSDVLAEVTMTLEDAATGVERQVEVTAFGECSDCTGSGAAPGTHPARCDSCGGSGELREVRRTLLGNVMTAAPCARCGGSGRVIMDPCRTCGGAGRVKLTDTLTVSIPAGVDDGAHLRVTGRGEAGVRGGRSGDLYVAVRIAEHEIFRRAGDDLACEVPVPMTIAALGGSVAIPTLGEPEDHDISPGTQSGEVVRLRGRGMPRVGRGGRGTLVALMRVETPTNLDPEQAELLAQFATLRNERAGHKGFFDKLKSSWR